MSKYGISDEVQADAGKPMFQPGITDNVVLSEAVFRNSKDDGSGTDVLTLIFRDERGGEFRYLVWDVNEAHTREMNQKYPRTHSRSNSVKGYVAGQPVTDDQAIDMAYADFFRKVKHIMTKFMSEEEAIIPPQNSYADFSKAVVAKLTPKCNDVKVRLKVVFNNNDYLTIPRYGNFIESMDVEATNLHIGPKDRITRTEPDAEEVSASAGSTSDSDLPI